MTGTLERLTQKSGRTGIEKIGAFFKYQALKIKGYFGKLSQPEFNELLADDFNLLLEDVPPFDGPFDPSTELEAVKKSPKDSRKEMLDTYKDRLARQREALAQCRLFIERSIEFNHDVHRDNLLGIIKQFGAVYGFTTAQIKQSETLINHYYKCRQAMVALRKIIPNNVYLASTLSGVRIRKNAKIEISLGAMTLDIVTDQDIFQKMLDEKKSFVQHFEGYSAEAEHHPNVYYTVADREARNHVVIHEREHNKNGLFRALFERKIQANDESLLRTRYKNERSTEIKQVLLQQYLQFLRITALNEARDEIIAMKRDGKSQYYADLMSITKDNAYDYPHGSRNLRKLRTNPLEREMTDRMLVDEYHQILEKALKAFELLQSEGVPTENIIALLTDKSLIEWPKTVKRLMERRTHV